MSEHTPYFPESSSEDDPDDDSEVSVEKKAKKDSKEKKLSIFEKPKEEKEPEKLKDDKAEKKDKETKPPLEELAEDEKKLVAEQYVEARVDDVREELADAIDDSPEEAAILANAALLENIQEKISEDEPITEALLDEAVTETLDDLGLEEVTEDTEEATEDSSEADDEEDADEEDDPAAAHTVIVPPVPPARVTPPPPGPVPPSPPPPPLPPVPPMPPTPPSPPGPPTGRGPSLPPLYGTPHVLRTPGIAPPAPEVVVVSDRRRERAHLLVGGIVGYLVGRRRGRIKTEKKLLPVQEKLQKEVVDLHDQIALREEKIRKLTREQVADKPIIQEKIIEKLQKKQEAKAVKQPEQARPEKLGKFAVLAERPNFKTPEKLKPAEAMAIPELLAIAAEIPAEQSTVKRLHETHRIDDEGLRRIVRAYQRGERIERLIHENLLSPEKYVARAEQHPDEHSTTSLLKQAISDPGTSSSFALPSLNSLSTAEERANFQKKRTKQKAAQTSAIFAALVVAGLIIFLATQ